MCVSSIIKIKLFYCVNTFICIVLILFSGENPSARNSCVFVCLHNLVKEFILEEVGMQLRFENWRVV